MLPSAVPPLSARQALSSLAPGPPGHRPMEGLPRRQLGSTYSSPHPSLDNDRAQCSGHLDSLAVVHLHHVEPEAVDTSDRGHEGTRGAIKATALIHQDLGEADPAEWAGDAWGPGKPRG